jgi:hypothetical protein
MIHTYLRVFDKLTFVTLCYIDANEYIFMPNSTKPPSPKGARGSLGAGGAPTSPTRATLGQDPTCASLVPKLAESSKPHVSWTRGCWWVST